MQEKLPDRLHNVTEGVKDVEYGGFKLGKRLLHQLGEIQNE